MKKIALILVLLLCASAEAKITKQTVNQAWQRIAQADGFPKVPIHYEADNDPNAWVRWQDAENFTVHVTAGLMKILNSESEIAGVLGHELGHIKLGHYGNIVLTDTARTIMTANLDRTDDLAQAVGNIDLELRESKFSREQETEADDYGVSLLNKAGYDVWGLYNAMKRFDANGYGSEQNGFNSHPASRERLSHLALMAQGSKTDSKRSNEVGDEVDDIASAMMGR